MDCRDYVNNVLHWNYRGFTEFPLQKIAGEEAEITDIYLKENLITQIPNDIGKLHNLESLYLSGNDISELPREISKLVCLKCLDVSGNRLKWVPEEIGELRNLKFLILDENELRQLPLRTVDLRRLRYLSVCDNQLEWISQRPVYNYYHCELRFWRNPSLQTMPYSLWYHMFRGRQTLSLNIGSLLINKQRKITSKRKFIIKIKQDDREHDVETVIPPNYKTIFSDQNMCPSLLELCKRKLYGLIYVAARNLSEGTFSVYSDFKLNGNHKSNGIEFEKTLEKFEITTINEKQTLLPASQDRFQNSLLDRKDYYVPSDIVNGYFYYLPSFLKNDLSNGPVSRCEYVLCRTPIFDYVLYEFCLEKIILIDEKMDVILSATFCSKTCRDLWKTGKNILSVLVK